MVAFKRLFFNFYNLYLSCCTYEKMVKICHLLEKVIANLDFAVLSF